MMAMEGTGIESFPDEVHRPGSLVNDIMPQEANKVASKSQSLVSLVWLRLNQDGEESFDDLVLDLVGFIAFSS